jgi:hypothetical protein
MPGVRGWIIFTLVRMTNAYPRMGAMGKRSKGKDSMKMVHAYIGWILIMFTSLSGCILSQDNEIDNEDDRFDIMSLQDNYNGYLNESERSEVIIPTNIDGPIKFVQINVSLTWTDEAVRIPLMNEPDIFGLDLLIENMNVSKEQNSSGRMDLNWRNDDRITIRNIRLVITCIHSGDIYYPGLTKREEDHGNEYFIEYQFEYMI